MSDENEAEKAPAIPQYTITLPANAQGQLIGSALLIVLPDGNTALVLGSPHDSRVPLEVVRRMFREMLDGTDLGGLVPRGMVS